MSNVFLARQSLDYFGDATKYNPFLQTWSLSVERQFYLFFPLVIILPIMLISHSSTKPRIVIGAVSAFILTLSFVYYLSFDNLAGPSC